MMGYAEPTGDLLGIQTLSHEAQTVPFPGGEDLHRRRLAITRLLAHSY
jgi:hypothetical protein